MTSSAAPYFCASMIVALACGPAPCLAEPGSSPVKPIVGLRDCANGGVVLPGSQTCLRLGGTVESSLSVETGRRNDGTTLGLKRGTTHLDSSARLNLDARTPTELGPLRVFTSVRLRSPGATLR